jgi:hypothetical protein
MNMNTIPMSQGPFLGNGGRGGKAFRYTWDRDLPYCDPNQEICPTSKYSRMILGQPSGGYPVRNPGLGQTGGEIAAGYVAQIDQSIAKVNAEIAKKEAELNYLESTGASDEATRQAGGELNDLLNQLEGLINLRARWQATVESYNRPFVPPSQTPVRPFGQPPVPAPAPAPPAPKPAPAPVASLPQLQPTPVVNLAPGQPGSPCARGQFFDGRTCRGSIKMGPSIPGGLPGGAGGGMTLPSDYGA